MIIIFGSSGTIGSYLKSKYPDSICLTHDNIEIADNVCIEDCFRGHNFDNFFDKLTIINCITRIDKNFIHKSNYDEWESILQTNVLGAYNISRYFLPIMRKQKYGNIINFSSVLVDKPVVGASCYITSKYALEGLTSAINIENEKSNIKAFCPRLNYIADTKLGDTYIPIDVVPDTLDSVYQYVDNIIIRKDNHGEITI